MEIRQLECFCIISRLENFTRTAEVLHVSQPSVTKAIKTLEAELHLTLIDRSQKHMALTSAGKAFLLHAKKILREVDETRCDMQRFQITKCDIIHFGMPPMVEAYLFPELFASFAAEYPDIVLDVQEYSDSSEVQERAENGALDFGIVFAQPEHALLSGFLIMQDSMQACLWQGHPLEKCDNIEFAQLKNEKFIMQQTNTYQYRNVYKRCMEQGFTPDILLCTRQLKTIKQLVANKLGISVLPAFVIRGESNFQWRPLSPELLINICLIWDKHKCLTETDKKFLSFMKKYAETEKFKKAFRQDA